MPVAAVYHWLLSVLSKKLKGERAPLPSQPASELEGAREEVRSIRSEYVLLEVEVKGM